MIYALASEKVAREMYNKSHVVISIYIYLSNDVGNKTLSLLGYQVTQSMGLRPYKLLILLCFNAG